MLQMAKFGSIQFVWSDLDMIWVQPQEGEYVVAQYEVQHAPCRILYPQGSWAVEGDVRRSDISLPAILYSTNEYSKHIPCAWLTARHPSLVPSGIRGMVRDMVPWAYVTRPHEWRISVARKRKTRMEKNLKQTCGRHMCMWIVLRVLTTSVRVWWE